MLGALRTFQLSRVTRSLSMHLRPLSVGSDLGQNTPLGSAQHSAPASSGSTSQAARPKRFFKNVSVVPANTVEAAESTDGYCIMLDKRILRTPKRTPVVHSNPVLVHALAEEWNAQEKQIIVGTMPLNRLFNTVADAIHDRSQYVESIMMYYSHDTLFYWASEPKKLADKMEEVWTPPLSAFSDAMGDVSITKDISSPVQEAKTTAAVEKYLSEQNYATLTAYNEMTSALKSFILPWALVHGHIDAAETVRASRVEEFVQIEEWGQVEGNHDLDEATVLTNVASAHFFLKNI